MKLPPFPNSPVIRQRVCFFGKVQKVGFRFEIAVLAKRLSLTGWACNRNDGSVEAEIQGTREQIDFAIRYMKSLKRLSVREYTAEDINVKTYETEFKRIAE